MLNKIIPINPCIDPILPTVYSEALSYIEQLNKVVYKCNEIIENINTFETNVTEEINSFADTINTINNSFTEINATLARHEKDLATIKTTLTNYIELFDELSDKFDSLTTRVTTLETSTSEIENNVTLMKSDITLLKAANTQTKQDINDLNTKVNKNTGDIGVLAIDYDTVSKDITTLNDRVTAQGTDIQNIYNDFENSLYGKNYGLSVANVLLWKTFVRNTAAYYNTHSIGSLSTVNFALTPSYGGCIVIRTDMDDGWININVLNNTYKYYDYVINKEGTVSYKYYIVPIAPNLTYVMQYYKSSDNSPHTCLLCNYTNESPLHPGRIVGSVTSSSGSVTTLDETYALFWVTE